MYKITIWSFFQFFFKMLGKKLFTSIWQQSMWSSFSGEQQSRNSPWGVLWTSWSIAWPKVITHMDKTSCLSGCAIGCSDLWVKTRLALLGLGKNNCLGSRPNSPQSIKENFRCAKRLYGIPDLPQAGLSKLLQLPSKERYFKKTIQMRTC